MSPRRRALFVALGAFPLVARLASAAPRKRLAFMEFGQASEWKKDWTDPFLAALAQQGIIPGRDVEVLFEAFEGEGLGRGPEVLAARVGRRIPEIRPDVIVTDGPVFTLIAQLATRTVPIVTRTPDPVGAGFAQSLAKPGGNVTGLADGVEETSVKTIELVRRLLPQATRVAIFSDPRPAASRFSANFEAAARRAGIEPILVLAKTHEEHAAALRGLRARNVPAALNAWPADHPRKLATEALAARVPLFAPDHDWVRIGYLGGYSAFEPEPMPKLAAVAAQVLRGAKPGDIPFQLPRQFRLALNRRTADAVGVKLPADLVLRADRVIE